MLFFKFNITKSSKIKLCYAQNQVYKNNLNNLLTSS